MELAETGYPATLISAAFVEGTTTKQDVTFDMYGRPYTNGKALASGSVVVAAGSRQRTVVVDFTTGKATVQ